MIDQDYVCFTSSKWLGYSDSFEQKLKSMQVTVVVITQRKPKCYSIICKSPISVHSNSKVDVEVNQIWMFVFAN